MSTLDTPSSSRMVARSRTAALSVALATLASNAITSMLLGQVESDPYGLVGAFECYLHMANVLSVFGFIGSLRQHPLSMDIFSTYLILDTIVFAVPRVVLVWLLPTMAGLVCEGLEGSWWDSEVKTWSIRGCERVAWWSRLALGACLAGAAVLQFVGALYVRRYARELWVQEVGDEARQRWLPVLEYVDEIDEVDEVPEGEKS